MQGTYKEREALRKVIGRRAPVESIVNHLFPRMSEQERQAMVSTFHKAGLYRGEDAGHWSFGRLFDELHIPERVCKALLDRELTKSGAPQEVMWYGRHSLSGRKPDARTIPKELDDIAAAAWSSLETEKRREYLRAVKGKTWFQVACEHMSEDEKPDILCNMAEVQIIYAYRAMLRIISQVLPVKLTLVEADSFMGTLYMASGGGTDLDWSQVVWVLQAKPPEMHYLEAMGRLVRSIKLVLEKQTLRRFAIGVIGSEEVLDTYMFWAEDQKLVDGKLVPVPRTVTNTMLSLHRVHTGIELLMMFMCAPPAWLGFPPEDASSEHEDNGSKHGDNGCAEEGDVKAAEQGENGLAELHLECSERRPFVLMCADAQ